jgi:phosphopantothenoylcysteine decarboxylase/phosphopantothenate--cysteine ligase
MSSLSGRCVLVGVTGGIAAYKSADLVRRLIEHGATVRVAMTASATKFISSLTLQSVSGQPVHDSLLDTDSETGMSHIELARWADQIIVAPATADFIARLATGLADDLLSTLCLATRAHIAVAPAMNHVMWDNPATQENIGTLRNRGVDILGPDSGNQACGETGLGRMMEPEALVNWLVSQTEDQLLTGLSVLITAGPTWEALDPVRGLTNQSSGKMGYAIAIAALQAGAKVSLISGPTALSSPPGVSTCRITTALDMLTEVDAQVSDADIFVSVAAVADYRPEAHQAQKIKKHTTSFSLELVRNPDILATVAGRSSPPFTVGFAAETENPVVQARQKLDSKKVDLMVANQVGGENSPFGRDDNALILVESQSETDLGRGSKQALARCLVRAIASRYHAKHSTPSS